ncbi:MAG: MATE family efflux transporter [Thermodesulfobacteriota bacterium]
MSLSYINIIFYGLVFFSLTFVLNAILTAQGFPASLNTMTIAIGIFIITWFLSRFGQAAVAAYGIATRVDQIALLPIMGLTTATLTLVGQNNGAALYDRCVEAYHKALFYGILVTTVSAIIVFIAPRAIMQVFTDDQAVVDIGAFYLRISTFIYWAYIILFVAVAALQGLKKPMYAIWIGLYRQIAAPAVAFYALAYLLGMGLTGIWWGIFLVTWSATIFTFFYVRRTMARMFSL